MNLVEISNTPKERLPIAKNTAYKWHSLKKYPALLFKVGGKLFFDLEEWDRMANEAKERQIKESMRIHRKAV